MFNYFWLEREFEMSHIFHARYSAVIPKCVSCMLEVMVKWETRTMHA